MHHPQLPFPLFHFEKGRVFKVPDLVVGTGRGYVRKKKRFVSSSNSLRIKFSRVFFFLFRIIITVDGSEHIFKVLTTGFKKVGEGVAI